MRRRSRAAVAALVVVGAFAASALEGDPSGSSESPPRESSPSGDVSADSRPEWLTDEGYDWSRVPDEIPAVAPNGGTVMVPSEILQTDPMDLRPDAEPVSGLEDDQVAIYGVRADGTWGVVRVIDCIEEGTETVCR